MRVGIAAVTRVQYRHEADPSMIPLPEEVPGDASGPSSYQPSLHRDEESVASLPEDIVCAGSVHAFNAVPMTDTLRSLPEEIQQRAISRELDACHLADTLRSLPEEIPRGPVDRVLSREADVLKMADTWRSLPEEIPAHIARDGALMETHAPIDELLALELCSRDTAESDNIEDHHVVESARSGDPSAPSGDASARSGDAAKSVESDLANLSQRHSLDFIGDSVQDDAPDVLEEIAKNDDALNALEEMCLEVEILEHEAAARGEVTDLMPDERPDTSVDSADEVQATVAADQEDPACGQPPAIDSDDVAGCVMTDQGASNADDLETLATLAECDGTQESQPEIACIDGDNTDEIAQGSAAVSAPDHCGDFQDDLENLVNSINDDIACQPCPTQMQGSGHLSEHVDGADDFASLTVAIHAEPDDSDPVDDDVACAVGSDIHGHAVDDLEALAAELYAESASHQAAYTEHADDMDSGVEVDDLQTLVDEIDAAAAPSQQLEPAGTGVEMTSHSPVENAALPHSASSGGDGRGRGMGSRARANSTSAVSITSVDPTGRRPTGPMLAPRQRSQSPRPLGPDAVMPFMKGMQFMQEEAAKKEAREAYLREYMRAHPSTGSRSSVKGRVDHMMPLLQEARMKQQDQEPIQAKRSSPVSVQNRARSPNKPPAQRAAVRAPLPRQNSSKALSPLHGAGSAIVRPKT